MFVVAERTAAKSMMKFLQGPVSFSVGAVGPITRINGWKNGTGKDARVKPLPHAIETREVWEQLDPNLKEEVEGPGGQITDPAEIGGVWI